MTSDTGSDTKIVFLHIPKTAGQTIHGELARVVGAKAVSPIRVHVQAGKNGLQMPPGYRLYSGHIDWLELDTLPEPRFVFTVLRDPLERIASFYFFVRRQAEQLSPELLARPGQTGMRMALENGPDDYFFGGDAKWQRFVNDHYNTTYCAYLATRRIRGWHNVKDVPPQMLLNRALKAAAGLDGVYSTEALDALERDVKERLGVEISVAGHYVNAAPEAATARRWPKLEAILEREESIVRLRRFALLDQRLMYRLGMGPEPEAVPEITAD